MVRTLFVRLSALAYIHMSNTLLVVDSARITLSYVCMRTSRHSMCSRPSPAPHNVDICCYMHSVALAIQSVQLSLFSVLLEFPLVVL